ncbi:RBCMT [Symbiodinium sp. CCMP2592]|nr:RBCMT [Symbiodinium sp. CCMP2592]
MRRSRAKVGASLLAAVFALSRLPALLSCFTAGSRDRSWSPQLRHPQCGLRSRLCALASATEENEWQRFAEWVAARGGDMANVEIADIDGMRGLVAARDIAENTSIVEIPLTASIDISEPGNDADPSAQALNLLKFLDDPELKPYMDLLPGRTSPDISRMPDFFSEEELKMLQCPEVVHKTHRRQQLCAKRADESSLDTEDVKWALCTVAQRAFSVVSPIDGLLRLLLPGIDLFNHDAHALHEMRVRWTLAGLVTATFKVVARSPIKKGEEIRICYGGNPFRPDGCGGDCTGDMALTNAAYLQRYGFVDDCFGTTMVDGKWLVKPESEPIRESLVETSAEEDEKLLSDGSLSIPAKTAIQFRRQLKIALKAQQEADALKAKAEAAKSEEQKQAEREAKEKAEEEARLKEANAEEARKQLFAALEARRWSNLSYGREYPYAAHVADVALDCTGQHIVVLEAPDGSVVDDVDAAPLWLSLLTYKHCDKLSLFLWQMKAIFTGWRGVWRGFDDAESLREGRHFAPSHEIRQSFAIQKPRELQVLVERDRVAMAGLQVLKPSSLEATHLLKMCSFILRLGVLVLVLGAGMLLLSTQDENTLAIRKAMTGTVSDSTCFFITSKDYGLSGRDMQLGSINLGDRTYCGVAADAIAAEVESVIDTLQQNEWKESCLPNLLPGSSDGCPCNPDSQACPQAETLSFEYLFQFFGAMCLGGAFEFESLLALGNSMYSQKDSEDGEDDTSTCGATGDFMLKEAWSYLLLTVLPQYILQPIGSVKTLPKPADKVLLIRTPPDYAFLQLWSFVILPLVTSLLCYTCLCQCKQRLQGEPGKKARLGCCFFASLGFALPVAILVPIGYFRMGNYFFIDWSFHFSFGLSFVMPAMIAKLLLGMLAVVDTFNLALKMIKALVKRDKASIAHAAVL